MIGERTTITLEDELNFIRTRISHSNKDEPSYELRHVNLDAL